MDGGNLTGWGLEPAGKFGISRRNHSCPVGCLRLSGICLLFLGRPLLQVGKEAKSKDQSQTSHPRQPDPTVPQRTLPSGLLFPNALELGLALAIL